MSLRPATGKGYASRTATKTLTAVLALALLAVGFIITADSSDVSASEPSGTCGDNLSWTYDSGTKALTITGSGAMYDYAISDKHWGGMWNSDIHTVSFPDGLTHIGAYAFEQGTHMTSVNIPDTVTSIGEGAFMGCALASLDLPNSITSIGDYAFANGEFTSLTIPGSMTTIEESSFYFCSNLSSLKIPGSVTLIKTEAFKNASLSEVVVPKNCTVEEHAFDDVVIIHYRDMISDSHPAEDERYEFVKYASLAIVCLMSLGLLIPGMMRKSN